MCIRDRPYVESMTKKVSAALVALVLGAATAWGAGVGQLTLLALAGCGALLVVGSTLRTLYLEAMRHRVERRFVPLTAGDDGPAAAEPLDDDGHFVESAAQTLRDAATAPDGRDQLAATVFQRFETGATGARLFLLREIGAGALLRDDHVAKLFASFDLWDAPVQVAGLRDVVASANSDDAQARSSSRPSARCSTARRRCSPRGRSRPKSSPTASCSTAAAALRSRESACLARAFCDCYTPP